MAGRDAAENADVLEQLARNGLRDFDGSALARAMYSSDASLYRVVPKVVVWPRDVDEVIQMLKDDLDACGREMKRLLDVNRRGSMFEGWPSPKDRLDA